MILAYFAQQWLKATILVFLSIYTYRKSDTLPARVNPDMQEPSLIPQL